MTSKVVADQLQQFINRFEKLEDEKKEISDHIKDLVQEAKSAGIDIKAFKEIIKLRKLEETERNTHESILYLYKKALGMYSNDLDEE